MKARSRWLVPVLLAVLWLGACKDDEARNQIAALTARVETAEAKLAKLNELHHWISDTWYPKYVELHKKVWGTGSGDPLPPPTPPPPFE